MNKLHPLTITHKLKDTAEFYKTYFGFTEAFTSDWYIQLTHTSSAEIGIMLPNQPNQPDFLQKEHDGNGIVFTIETDDATAMYNSLRDKKAPIVHELRDEEWGQRHFILKDPAGIYVDIVQYI